MAGHAKASTERCPSWRQLYRITFTLCEAAGIEPPRSAAQASEFIARLDALSGEAGQPAEPALTVTRGASCDDIPF